MTAQLYRIDVFPRLAFHPENAPYVGTSYRLKATGQVDLERVKTVLSDPLVEKFVRCPMGWRFMAIMSWTFNSPLG